MNYESKLCKLSDGETHQQRQLTIIDCENVLPLGRIITHASGYFALTHVKTLPFKVTSVNVRSWSKDLDYYADIVRNIVIAWLSEKSFVTSSAKSKREGYR